MIFNEDHIDRANNMQLTEQEMNKILVVWSLGTVTWMGEKY